ncbi:hypothetical protein Pst134EA_001073 [Puccinia striiformis f. sp. tritici]|uniref:hypothetical protein n=1 Tax=Puccinia striiformis f. sp. tritici TaxID=168172 RepID=UPI002008B9E7|nr:hypothetical protein Pst134EA_001073 [Puccinia striiformis f. sp. tritici]KAH9474020.1 hypothetical protein Pst134EA_001073 [Puccinia striiformis f. sp. tritici]
MKSNSLLLISTWFTLLVSKNVGASMLMERDPLMWSGLWGVVESTAQITHDYHYPGPRSLAHTPGIRSGIIEDHFLDAPYRTINSFEGSSVLHAVGYSTPSEINELREGHPEATSASKSLDVTEPSSSSGMKQVQEEQPKDTQGSRSTDVADPFTPPKADKLRKSFRINAQSARDSRTAGLSATPKIHRVNRKFKVSAARLMISETPSLKGSWSEIPKHLMIDKKPIKYDVSKQFGKISRKAPWVWDPEKGIDLHILMNKVTKDQDQQYVTVWNKSSTHSVIYTLHDKQSDLYLWEKKLDPNVSIEGQRIIQGNVLGLGAVMGFGKLERGKKIKNNRS